MLGASLEVLGRREDEYTEYFLAEVDAEVPNITGDEMRGSSRDSPTENRPILVAELYVAADIGVEDPGRDHLDRLQESVQSLLLIGIRQISSSLLNGVF